MNSVEQDEAIRELQEQVGTLQDQLLKLAQAVHTLGLSQNERLERVEHPWAVLTRAAPTTS